MRLLVTGATPVEAGKTTFAAGLVSHTGAVGFKPRAGSDYWFHHGRVRDALADGRLVGADAATLAEASPGSLVPEDVNAVHRLWAPSPGPDQGLLGQEDGDLLVDRAGDRFVVNDTVDVPDPVTTALPLSDAVTVASTEELNHAMEQYHLPALEALSEAIDRADLAVVESYADVARPVRAGTPTAVAVVEPLRARFYDGDRFVRACEVATRSPHEGRLEERVGSVVDLLDARATVELPPLGAEERDDPSAVASAYAGGYERLLDVADTA